MFLFAISTKMGINAEGFSHVVLEKFSHNNNYMYNEFMELANEHLYMLSLTHSLSTRIEKKTQL